MRIHTFIKRLLPLVACFLIATACNPVDIQETENSILTRTHAANQGDVWAQFKLGVAYDFGRGVPQNMATAYAWYNVASANGNEAASDPRDNVAKLMTPEQLAEAQKLSRE